MPRYDPINPSRPLTAEEAARFYGLPPATLPGSVLPASGMTPYAPLTNSINTLMTDQARMPFEANLPGYGANVAQRGVNTGSMLRGEVPADVIRQIQQTGAERGIATGSPGSSNANAAWLQALGLTSIGLQQQGSQQLTQSIADTPVPELFNPASLFVPQTLAREGYAAARAGQFSQPAVAPQAQSNAWNANRAPSTTYTNFMGMGGGRW